MHLRRAALLLLTLPVAASCAQGRNIRMDPAYVTVDKEELEVSGFNPAELWACGKAAAAAGNHRRASLCFGRLADDYPADSNAREAGYQAGIALQNMKKWPEAVARFRVFMDAARGHGQELDAAWRAATCLYQAGDYRNAIDVLTPITTREDLATEDVIHAMTHVGVCLVEMGEPDEAEKRLRQALDLYGSGPRTSASRTTSPPRPSSSSGRSTACTSRTFTSPRSTTRTSWPRIWNTRPSCCCRRRGTT